MKRPVSFIMNGRDETHTYSAQRSLNGNLIRGLAIF